MNKIQLIRKIAKSKDCICRWSQFKEIHLKDCPVLMAKDFLKKDRKAKKLKMSFKRISATIPKEMINWPDTLDFTWNMETKEIEL